MIWKYIKKKCAEHCKHIEADTDNSIAFILKIKSIYFNYCASDVSVLRTDSAKDLCVMLRK
jgi:hypothetical protein